MEGIKVLEGVVQEVLEVGESEAAAIPAIYSVPCASMRHDTVWYRLAI